MELPPALAAAMPFARHDVRLDGVRLSVADDQADGAEGSTILFLHGNPTWSYLWRRPMAAAKAAGHRVVAPDHAGFGASDKPTDGSYYSLDRHVENLEAVADARDLRDVTLVLHDWGGPIGMSFAARQPDRVRRIVIANTVAFAPKARRALSKWHKTMASPLGYFAGVNLNAVARTAMKHGVRTPLPRDVWNAYMWPMKNRGARVAAARFVQLVPDGPEHPSAAGLRAVEAAAEKLRAKPMRVLWADRDPVFPPKFAERWLRDYPDAEVSHVSKTAGHFWQEDDPDAFVAPILEFAGR